MDATLVGCVIAVGGVTFAATFFALSTGRGAGRTVAAVVGPDVVSTLARSFSSLPLVASLRMRGEQKRRRSLVLRELPAMLDVLTLGLSAGLSFDASLELYCQRHQTELSVTMGEALLSWRMGTVRRDEALHAAGEALGSSALRRFADAVSQALAFGAPLALALEQQAQVIRDEQRSELEAEIERVPVKLLIPLGTLIVPAMLLAILGPLLAPAIAGLS